MSQATATKTKDQQGNPQAELPINKGEVAVFQAPRLPFHDAIKERFGIDRGSWKVLTEAIFPSAKSPDAIVLALSYCRARNLDIMKKPVHIVPMWSSAAHDYVETIWPSIAELRTTAFRTGNYAGCDVAEFGPVVKTEFKGRVQEYENGQKVWKDRAVTVEHPQWCRITVHRMMPNGQRVAFVGPKVIWLESYATIGRSELPNDMWQSRPEGQIEKCAEAAALRRAFPEELGNEYAAEEMEGRIIRDVTPVAPKTAPKAPAPPDPDAPQDAPAEGEVLPPAGKEAQPGDPAEDAAVDLLMNLTDLVGDMRTKKTPDEIDRWMSDKLVEASIDALSDEERRLFEKTLNATTSELMKPKKK